MCMSDELMFLIYRFTKTDFKAHQHFPQLWSAAPKADPVITDSSLLQQIVCNSPTL